MTTDTDSQEMAHRNNGGCIFAWTTACRSNPRPYMHPIALMAISSN